MAPKRGGGIFESCDIFLENRPTSHAVSLALVICACSGSAMPLFAMRLLTYATTAMVHVCLCAASWVLLA